MQELKPLPCPACKSKFYSVESGEDLITHEEYNQIRCSVCGLRAPEVFGSGISAVEVWNALPRALRWTTEPPRVAGDCYVRTRPDESEPWGKPFVVFFSESYLKELESSPFIQYAGPIPAPVEL